MSAPLAIYECPNGHEKLGPTEGALHACTICGATEVRETRVFREEDVRPLWEFCASLLQKEDAERQAMAAAFPAPDEWKKTGA